MLAPPSVRAVRSIVCPCAATSHPGEVGGRSKRGMLLEFGGQRILIHPRGDRQVRPDERASATSAAVIGALWAAESAWAAAIPSARRSASDWPVLGRAVVVLARRDVSGGTVEMNEENARLRLIAQPPRDPDEIATDATVAVIALRMGGVVTQHDHRLFAVPEADRPERTGR